MPHSATYTVRRGETLWAIARRIGSRVADLVRLNRIANPDRIAVGLVLRTRAPEPEVTAAAQSRRPAPPPRLGHLSAKYETGGRGPGTVSSGRGDRGGASYGLYQLASRFDQPRRFLEAEGRPWAERFTSLEQGSEAFTLAWQDCAAQDAEAFAAAQHAYIERTHYLPQCRRIRGATGLDPQSRSPALRDVVWSVAVQHGPASQLVSRCIAALQARPEAPDYDRRLIEAIYRERSRRDAAGRLVHFSGNSHAVQEGVSARFRAECADALAMLGG